MLGRTELGVVDCKVPRPSDIHRRSRGSSPFTSSHPGESGFHASGFHRVPDVPWGISISHVRIKGHKIGRPSGRNSPDGGGGWRGTVTMCASVQVVGRQGSSERRHVEPLFPSHRTDSPPHPHPRRLRYEEPFIWSGRRWHSEPKPRPKPSLARRTCDGRTVGGRRGGGETVVLKGPVGGEGLCERGERVRRTAVGATDECRQSHIGSSDRSFEPSPQPTSWSGSVKVVWSWQEGKEREARRN